MSGYIFCCTNVTQEECIEKRLFGSPRVNLLHYSNVKKGDKLFLYNLMSRKLYGVFYAESDVRLDIVPSVWKGKFPVQVNIKWGKSYTSINYEEISSLIKFKKTRTGMYPPYLIFDQQVRYLEEKFENLKKISSWDIPFRSKFKPNICTDDGHYVRSLSEKIIDDYLFRQRITHGYERKIPLIEDIYCDFWIPSKDNYKCVYVEYWGLEDEKYKERKKLKEIFIKKIT